MAFTFKRADVLVPEADVIAALPAVTANMDITGISSLYTSPSGVDANLTVVLAASSLQVNDDVVLSIVGAPFNTPGEYVVKDANTQVDANGNPVIWFQIEKTPAG